MTLVANGCNINCFRNNHDTNTNQYVIAFIKKNIGLDLLKNLLFISYNKNKIIAILRST